jgi:cytochrome c oxidase assembly protein subunit 15
VSAAQTTSTSPWPRRFALATLWASVPLILFGGTVTTLRAGMAEDGWLAPDGYWLWLYPLELRLRSAGVFVEHHHREIGSLVGLLAIGLVFSTWRCDRRRSTRGLALATLAAIGLQGTIGGLRVLENDPSLAFLHGALAHAVFALIGANACLLAADWPTAGRTVSDRAGALSRATLTGVLVVYAQIVAGAWLRHSGAPAALALHLVLAAAVLFEVLRAARHLAQAGSERLARAARRLRLLVGLQLLLGAAAALGVYGYSGGFQGQVSGFELVFATLHVLVGALLLWQTLAAALWTRRLLEPAPADVGAGLARLEGAR